jgi:hypothetical protein
MFVLLLCEDCWMAFTFVDDIIWCMYKCICTNEERHGIVSNWHGKGSTQYNGAAKRTIGRASLMSLP